MTDERDPDSASTSDEPLGDLASAVRDRTGETDARAESPRRDGPLADVAAEVDERKRRRRASDDPFESVDVGEIDGEKLWERLAEGDDEGMGVSVPPEAVDDAEGFDGRDVRTIPKDTCHGCPHLADPPELACSHEGTAILEMVDSEHFRVADCPMVVDEESFDPLGADAEDAEDADDAE
ncbi:hypothetical protein NGM10_10945 [Halorussus salilacus]|uniref:hypothetical protein n=1 Tax=Halorussus salilacus TaxID=2953750 RepID=UPI00209C7531|nr:hypothetical protein [Halorussus salilacus]USZ67246.1 hypothetical protein NGM10_10945 [Halorussus salilacus]